MADLVTGKYTTVGNTTKPSLPCSYPTDDGRLFQLRYTAGVGGFQPVYSFVPFSNLASGEAGGAHQASGVSPVI